MRSRMSWIFLLVAMVIIAGQPFIHRVHAAPAYITENSDPDAELSLWGIENGCLNSALVHHFYVINAHAAMIELIGGKRVLMRFRGDCQGIEQYGFGLNRSDWTRINPGPPCRPSDVRLSS